MKAPQTTHGEQPKAKNQSPVHQSPVLATLVLGIGLLITLFGDDVYRCLIKDHMPSEEAVQRVLQKRAAQSAIKFLEF
jgi:hypothetical protein